MTPAPEKPKSTPRRLRFRMLVKLALLMIFIAILISALQILVPALAYRDDLIALLNYSDDCKAPCFMGITPGKTTYDETVATLATIEGITYNTDYYISPTQGGSVLVVLNKPEVHYYIHFDKNIVRAVGIVDPGMTFTTVLLTLGQPDAHVAGYPGDGGLYLDNGLRVRLSSCEDLYQYFAAPVYALEFYAINDDLYTRLYPFKLQPPSCLWFGMF